MPKTGEVGPSAAWRSLVVPTAGANEPPLRTDRDVGFDLFPKAIWFLLGEKLSPQDADVVMPQVVRFFAEAFEKRASVPVSGEISQWITGFFSTSFDLREEVAKVKLFVDRISDPKVFEAVRTQLSEEERVQAISLEEAVRRLAENAGIHYVRRATDSHRNKSRLHKLSFM